MPVAEPTEGRGSVIRYFHRDFSTGIANLWRKRRGVLAMHPLRRPNRVPDVNSHLNGFALHQLAVAPINCRLCGVPELSGGV